MADEIEVLFVVGFGPVMREVEANLALFRDTLGLPVTAASAEPDYFTISKLEATCRVALGCWLVERLYSAVA